MGKKASKATRQKHQPVRTCVLCRQTSSKRELIRLVRTAEEGVMHDPSGKQNGRGAYICTDPTCWKEQAGLETPERALQQAYRKIEQALRTNLTPEDQERIQTVMLKKN